MRPLPALRAAPVALAPQIDPAWTVHETLRRHPATAVVFTAFAVDTCRGGADALPDAARAADLDPISLLEALESILRPDAVAAAPALRGGA